MQLHYAAARNDFRAVQRQLAKGVSVDNISLALMLASKSPKASVEMLQMLVKAGAVVNPVPPNNHDTPLGVAAKEGDFDKVLYLVEAGADPRYVSSDRYTPLLNAVYHFANHKPEQRIQIVRLLLDAGASPNVTTIHNEVALRTALYFSNFTILKMLIDAHAHLDVLEWTPLMRAVAVGDVESVQSEIRLGGDLEARNKYHWSAWSIAVALGDIQKAELVINSSSLFDHDLTLAVRKDNPEMVAWLLSLGADPNEIGGFGRSALMEAAAFGSTECVGVLLEAKANTELLDHSKHKAISRAANSEIARLLAAAGTDINYEDGEGYTLLKNAAEEGNDEIVRTLLDLGADPDASRLNDTPLRVAVREDHLDIVKMLLEAGADPNIHTLADGWCPLGEVKTVETLQVLLDAGADPRLNSYSEYDPVQFLTDPELIDMIEAAKQPRKRRAQSIKRKKR